MLLLHRLIGRRLVSSSHPKARDSFACTLKVWAEEQASAIVHTEGEGLSPAALAKVRDMEKREWCEKVGYIMLYCCQEGKSCRLRRCTYNEAFRAFL